MSRSFNNPTGGTPSTVGPQLTDHFYQKKALIEAAKEQYFSQLADVTSMPKNMGKKIKRFHYLPMLDDANVNDQGIDASGATIANGNLYGSSKDIGTISGKLPVLSETGGRVNRVGFKRKEIEGTFAKFGFFDEYTQESLDFDTDSELMQHINSEMVKGANEITEDALQIDLINAAGVVRFAGDATQNSEVDTNCIVSYGDMMRLAITLDNNRTPKSTKVIAGSRMVDTKTINGGRIAYIGSELLPTFKAMKDLHNNPAFISIEKYADAGNTVRGEVGAVDNFRLVVVPEMMKWSGAGAVTTDSINYDNGANYDVFPILVVGDESFTTIGFQTDGKSVKFTITHKAPGKETADRNDPYGETGFMSIKWYYGFMILRSERIALIKTAARL
jgi:N4-gp56 family major capsid protein